MERSDAHETVRLPLWLRIVLLSRHVAGDRAAFRYRYYKRPVT